jgi:hypothetical protein
MTPRETYTENMKRELDELNDQLDTYETKVTPARRDARDRYAVDLGELRRHSVAAQAKWEGLQACSEGSWHQRVTDMDHMRDAFIRAFHAFRARL